MAHLSQELNTGIKITTWNYSSMITTGQTMGFENKYGQCVPLVSVESVNFGSDGFKNRIVIKKENLEKYGFVIVED